MADPLMKTVNIHEAKTHLSRLVERVEGGEEIVIARSGRPAARLVPIESAGAPVRTGGLKSASRIPDDFDTMFAGEIEALFSASAPAPASVGRIARRSRKPR